MIYSKLKDILENYFIAFMAAFDLMWPSILLLTLNASFKEKLHSVFMCIAHNIIHYKLFEALNNSEVRCTV